MLLDEFFMGVHVFTFFVFCSALYIIDCVGGQKMWQMRASMRSVRPV